MRPPFDPTLYLVTDTALAGPRGVPDVVRAAVAGGVTAVQVRDKDASCRQLYALTLSVKEVLAGTGVALFVNDDVEVALMAGADGVHVGQDDLPAAEVRERIGPDRLLGLSTGSDDELDVALALPSGTVDVVGIGPVWTTPTKPDAGAGLGPEGVAALAARAAAGGLRSVAIGGISPERAALVTGVDGICVVSAICAADDPAAAARALREVTTR
ncbi:thiamine-phosphate pyrophosphorylase [Geodermatophilus tzadiensis]|uniref:Thiamine-phosphate synthase n=1 Tax=Geodermatophilus tzadiensis TaxID=1137988 RepID=A0A2T0TPR9_9ACTN|nr:thiamine phosphate synthase [Geodermatophilus tzadiensis]PRY47712.1 thiamine-phosphate pyrophosphorylase [Geodermatophilus tzadiensis]